MKAKVKHLFKFIILSLVLFGCAKQQEQIVPYVTVNFSVSLSLPEFSVLNSVNNAYIKRNVGYNYNGVIVYRNSIDEFTAFDATCPKHIETKTAVALDGGAGSGQAKCPNCKTVYYFFNYAYPSSGYPLRQYKVIMTGSSSFYVSN